MRRAISILLYLIGGMFVMTQAAMAFATTDAEVGKGTMLILMAPFAVVPLALGALISPGRRIRELGIVLLTAAGWMAFTAATLAFMVLMPDTRPLMPIDALQIFGDYWFGTAHLTVLGGLGLLMVLHRRRPLGRAQDIEGS